MIMSSFKDVEAEEGVKDKYTSGHHWAHGHYENWHDDISWNISLDTLKILHDDSLQIE